MIRIATMLVLATLMASSAGVSAVSAEKKGRSYRSGQLTAASARGGARTFSPRSGPSRGGAPVWWVYCIKDGGGRNVGASKHSPAKLGLSVNTAVRFAVEGERLFVVNSQGRELALFVMKDSRERICQ